MTRATAITQRVPPKPEPGPYDVGGEFGPEARDVTPQPDGLAHATALVGAPPTRIEAPATSIEAPAEEARGELVPDKPEPESLVQRVDDLGERERAREAHITNLEGQNATLRTAFARGQERVGELEGELAAMRAEFAKLAKWVGYQPEGGV